MRFVSVSYYIDTLACVMEVASDKTSGDLALPMRQPLQGSDISPAATVYSSMQEYAPECGVAPVRTSLC